MPSTSDKSTDKISLAQAVRWIETRADTPGASPCGIVSRASVDRLYEALKSGKIQATGCVDGRRRAPISADEWYDYDLVLTRVSFPNVGFMNAPPTPVVEAISKRSYPATAVDLHHRLSALRLPSTRSATGEPGYRRVIDDVLLSREDVVAHWPANGTLASTPRPKQRRKRTRPARAAAVAAIAEIYPESVPDQVAVPNRTLGSADELLGKVEAFRQREGLTEAHALNFIAGRCRDSGRILEHAW
jgi:hypothetical protein